MSAHKAVTKTKLNSDLNKSVLPQRVVPPVPLLFSLFLAEPGSEATLVHNIQEKVNVRLV